MAAQAKGQPLVAGAVAFGLGFHAAAAFPGTPAEGQLAHRVQDMAQPAVDQLKESGQEAVSGRRNPLSKVRTISRRPRRKVRTRFVRRPMRPSDTPRTLPLREASRWATR